MHRRGYPPAICRTIAPLPHGVKKSPILNGGGCTGCLRSTACDRMRFLRAPWRCQPIAHLARGHPFTFRHHAPPVELPTRCATRRGSHPARAGSAVFYRATGAPGHGSSGQIAALHSAAPIQRPTRRSPLKNLQAPATSSMAIAHWGCSAMTRSTRA